VLHTLRNAVLGAFNGVNGAARYGARRYFVAASANNQTARPSTVIIPLRPMQAAWISSSSSKPAQAEAHSQTHGLVSTGVSAAVPSSKIKGEVLLPSQEGKKGAMQFAL